jgi:hypothetical protein
LESEPREFQGSGKIAEGKYLSNRVQIVEYLRRY